MPGRWLFYVSTTIVVTSLMPLAGILGLVFIARTWRESRWGRKVLLVLYVIAILFCSTVFLHAVGNNFKALRWLVELDIYELIAVAGLLLAYLILRLSNRPGSKSFSYLAIFSATSVVLNPYFLETVFIREHLPFAVVSGSERPRSFVMGVVALLTGIMAIKDILCSQGDLRGLLFAFVGIIGGTIWAVYWIWFYLSFISAMRGW